MNELMQYVRPGFLSPQTKRASEHVQRCPFPSEDRPAAPPAAFLPLPDPLLLGPR